MHRRKNSGFEDTFDTMNAQQCGWLTSDTPWKQLKKEKKAARKNRKIKRHENHNNSSILMEPNNPVEENNDSVLKSGIILFISAITRFSIHDATEHDVKNPLMTL